MIYISKIVTRLFFCVATTRTSSIDSKTQINWLQTVNQTVNYNRLSKSFPCTPIHFNPGPIQLQSSSQTSE